MERSSIAFRVKPAAERQIRQGHPWVFENSIVRQGAEGRAGDIAVLFDQKKNKLLAVGLYDPGSPVRIKLVSFGKPARMDTGWFQDRVQEAFRMRSPLLKTDTNSYRLIHGENDGFPGLVADVYDKALVIKIYSLIWLPFLEILTTVLRETAGCEVVVLRLSRNVQRDSRLPEGFKDGMVLYGMLEREEVIFREYGLLFSANLIRGHKTGFFLDHRHNRKRIGELSMGKRILDVFSYAGGFSVHALAGGAREVTSLDISHQALEMARRNASYNLSDLTSLQTLAMDAFAGMEKLYQEEKQFDLIVIDPPSFAKQEEEIPKALHSYIRLTRLGVRLTAPGGILMMASCSSRISPDSFFGAVEKEIRNLTGRLVVLEKSGHDIDHPIGFPEGTYLKAGYYRI